MTIRKTITLVRFILPSTILLFLLISINFFVSSTAYAASEPPELWGDGTLRRMRVPILMYHYVSDLPVDADPIRQGLTISPERFEQHLRYLQASNYYTISIRNLHLALDYGKSLPINSVVLTFDDGYQDHYRNVYPLLQSYGMTGTFFVITGFADKNAQNHLTWNEIVEMALANMEIQAHTKTHPDLRVRSTDFLVYQILGSLQSIDFHTGIPATYLAYPAGRYDDNVLNVLQSMPVERAFTTQAGIVHTTDNRYEMYRLRIQPNMSISGLESLLRRS